MAKETRGFERGNPFKLTAASPEQFVGRADILAAWEERLRPGSDAWNEAKSWLVIGEGGVGKSSLLNKMGKIAKDAGVEHLVSLDLGYYRQEEQREDLILFLDSKLPPVRKDSTRVRLWFDLPVDTPGDEVGGAAASTTLNVLSQKFTGVDLSNRDAGPLKHLSTREMEFLERLVESFKKLAVLSEEQGDRPVVLLVDQLGKAHDSEEWRTIAYQFVRLAERVWQRRSSNVVLAYFVRPQRKELLAHELERRIDVAFRREVFHYGRLYPFSEAEAVEAIHERTRSFGWNRGIAGSIARGLAAETGRVGDQQPERAVEPYDAVLAGAAVWEYLKEQNLEAGELDDAVLGDVVRRRHEKVLQAVRQGSETQWQVLALLSFYSNGLTVKAITTQLNKRDLNLSLTEVEKAVDALSDTASMRLLDSHGPEPLRYALSHENLGEYLQREMPFDEKELERARRILEDGVWRYEQGGSASPYSPLELGWLLEHGEQLRIGPVESLVITCSELNSDRPLLQYWAERRHESFRVAIAEVAEQDLARHEHRRFLLAKWYLFGGRDDLRAVLRTTAELANHDLARLGSAVLLGKSGDTATAIQVLHKLALEAMQEDIRLSAVQELIALGEPALSAIGDLAQTAVDEKARWIAVEALANEGERALEDLSKVALEVGDDAVCWLAVEGLGAIGKPALSVLTRIVSNSWIGRYVRLGAVEALRTIGNPALATLLKLTRYGEDEYVRWRAAEAVGALGLVELELSVLSELALRARNEEVRHHVVEALAAIEQPAVTFLSYLAKYGDNELVCESAVEALATIGQPAKAELREIALSESEGAARLIAAKALGASGDSDLAINVMSELAWSADDELVRLQAIEDLGEIGEPSIPILRELTWIDEDESVRRTAIEALGQIGLPTLAMLRESAANDKSEYVRLCAVAALENIGLPALPALKMVSASEKSGSVLLRVAEALGFLGESDKAVAIMEEIAYWSDDEAVSLGVTKGLSKVDRADLAMRVMDLLLIKPAEKHVWWRAVRELVDMGEPGMVVLADLVNSIVRQVDRRGSSPILLSFSLSPGSTLDRELWIRHFNTIPMLDRVLAELDEEYMGLAWHELNRFVQSGCLGLAILMRLFRHSMIRNRVTPSKLAEIYEESLGHILDWHLGDLIAEDERDRFQDLAMTLVLSNLAWKKDYDPEVRLEAVRVLGLMEEPAAAVLSDLAVEDASLQQTVCEALTMSGELGLVALCRLAQGESDSMKQLRRDSVEALAAMGELAHSKLIELVQAAEDPWVRGRAAFALGQLGNTDLAVRVLRELTLYGQDPVVRHSAPEAMSALGVAALPALFELAWSAASEDDHWYGHLLFQVIRAAGTIELD